MSTAALTSTGRTIILVTGFLGWFGAGMHMAITQLSGQSAAIDLLDRSGALEKQRYQFLNKELQQRKKDQPLPPGISASDEAEHKAGKALVARWFAWYQCAFLFGAATGGLFFGWLGDRIGRSKGMAASILCYSLGAVAASFAQDPGQLLALIFLTCLGVGGMWPNGVALVSEAWATMSRPMVAGIIGTAANIGIFVMASLAAAFAITSDKWRWAYLIGALPGVLGLFSLIAVPESPRWLAARAEGFAAQSASVSMSEVFRGPYFAITLVGIVLATIPLFGGWGTANWMIPWADAAGEAASPPNPFLKAQVQQARSITGIVGSLLGGWIASVFGRRRSYFFTSLIALGIAQYTFWFVIPTDWDFLIWVAALGFFSGVFFGWLPLFLPELFPTRIRSTGAGVSFNFGRILTAGTIFLTGALMTFFEGDYARIGRWTSLVYLLGMFAVLLAPDTSKKQLAD